MQYSHCVNISFLFLVISLSFFMSCSCECDPIELFVKKVDLKVAISNELEYFNDQEVGYLIQVASTVFA